MTICIAGKNQIAVDGLLYSVKKLNGRCRIIGIPNKSDTGSNTWQPSFKRACEENGIEIVDLMQCYDMSDLVFLSLEFDKLIKPQYFKSKRLYNIHFSLLPLYKGMFTSVWPILNGESKTGVTLHKIEPGIDTGDIIAQKEFQIENYHNSRDLYFLYNEYALKLFEENLDSLINGEISSYMQAIEKSTYYSNNSINFSNVTIENFRQTAWQIHNQIRAFSFREYQLPKIFGRSVYKSLILDKKSEGKPGEIYEETPYWITLSSIDYLIRIYWDKEECIYAAATKGDIAEIESHRLNGYDLFVRNKIGWNLLIVACYNNHFELVKYLLSLGFSPNSQNYKGTSALMYAKSGAEVSGDLSIVNLLVEKGADLFHKDDMGKNTIDYMLESQSGIFKKYLTC